MSIPTPGDDRFMGGAARTEAASLPIGDVLDPLREALGSIGRAVLVAPPGAGKTTIVPLALADEDWCDGTVVVLEPRRLAVRNAAARLAALVGERPGRRVGWRMRGDTKVSAATRIEIVTEGVLTRRLQNDPGLDGVAAVVFDEFHERSLDADLGLTLTLDVAASLRPDLRLVVMSATLDTERVASLLDAPVVRSEGRLHPVDVVHVPTDRRARIEDAVTPVIRRAVTEHDGDVLVFLPGAAEIDRVARMLPDLPAVDVHRLHGRLPPEEQDAAIMPAPPGRRKVVLSTSIAETSLTIDGVTVVVDAGWRRTPRMDPSTGMSRLVTLAVTRAEADQRAGRAGRLGPGVAYRLWDRATDAQLLDHPEPEIEVADLAPLALDLAAWGAAADELSWIDPPPGAHLDAARELLRRLDALDDAGALTPHGRALATLPLHPRLGHVLQRGAELGHGALAGDVAAALGEHRLGTRSSSDVADRLRTMRRPPTGAGGGTRAAASRARAEARRLRRLVDAGDDATEGSFEDRLGLLLALGFPDRIGRRRPDRRGEFLLVNGRGAFVDDGDPLAGEEFLCAVELDGDPRRARIRAAAPLDEDDVRLAAGATIETTSEVRWDQTAGDVVARIREHLGAVTLSERPADDVPAESYVAALLDGLRAEGASLLPWTDELRTLQARLSFLHRLDPGTWPAVDDDHLVTTAEERIGPHLAGARRRRDLRKLDLREVLLAPLGWSERGRIDDLAPERLEVPSGNRHRVDYTEDPPVLAVKLQEMFGATETPTVGGGRVPVVVHLLSPAGRPLQVTQDLASFWRNAYAQVRADMRGRYPKHPWPEDPLDAEPTSRTKRRR